MNNSTPLCDTPEKWTSMQRIVQENPFLLTTNFPQQFKKMLFIRRITENLLIFLLQYCGLMFSTFTSKPGPLWLATGTACAFIFMRGYTIVPGIWLGSFVTYFLNFPDLLTACSWATILSLEACALFWMGQRSSYPTLLFYKKRSFFQFIGIAGFITALTSFLLLISYDSNINHFNQKLFMQWWLGNLNGIFIISIGLITLDAYFPELSSSKKKPSRLTVSIFAGYFLIVSSFFMTPSLTANLLTEFVTILFTILISTKYGRFGHALAIFIFACVAIFFINFSSHAQAAFSKHFIFFQSILLLNTLIGLFTCLVFKREISLRESNR